jgi:hypothetical protein
MSSRSCGCSTCNHSRPPASVSSLSHQSHLLCSSRRQHQRQQSQQSLSRLLCTRIWQIGLVSVRTWEIWRLGCRRPGHQIGSQSAMISVGYELAFFIHLHLLFLFLILLPYPCISIIFFKQRGHFHFHLRQSSDDMRPDIHREFRSTHWAPEFFCQMGAPAGQSPT